MRRRQFVGIAGAAAAGLVPRRPAAETPLRIVVAYAVGGVSSEIARAIAQRLERRLARTVLVEHRPGAGGVIALDAAARGPADGSLLVFSAVTPLTLAPLLGPVPYDPQRDIAPLIAWMATPVLVLGTPALGAANFTEAIVFARRAPGALRWASSGVGTTGHLVQQRVAEAAGVLITHVPYSGGGRQLTDALGGQFELLSSNVAAGPLRLVREGRLAALAVSGAQRVPQLPDVPTLAELGFAAANQVSTFGLFAPGRTPPQRLAALHAALAQVLAEPAMQDRLRETDNLPLGGSAADFVRRIEAEREAHRAWLQRPR
jgi:tripartite-type tricarboxylate transporter receptor subunit TctC